jgi:hypothetical protein
MFSQRIIESIPLWAIFLGTIVIILVAARVGLLLGRIKRRPEGEPEGPIGAVVGATLALLAFLLAFTFNLAAQWYIDRRQLLLDEVTAIETSYLRAGLTPEPQRSELRKLLRKYVEVRTHLVENPQTIQKSEELQAQMWPYAESLAEAHLKNPDIVTLFVESLNQAFQLHTKRLTVGLYRIPPPVWVLLLGVTILAMVGVGYHFGRAGRGSWQVNLLLALTFAMVILLIFDLDRNRSGWLIVNQQPMVELQKRLERQPTPGVPGSARPFGHSVISYEP